MEKRPIGLRFAGWYLIVIGVMMAGLGAMTDGQPVEDAVFVWWVASGILVVIGGIGLLRDARWGWALGVILGLAAIGFSAFAIRVTGADLTEIGAYAGLFFLMLVPGLLLLGVLLQPATIRWFRLRRVSMPPLPPPPPS